MKVSIIGSPNYVNGTLSITLVIGTGAAARGVELPLAADMPSEGWESVLRSNEPFMIKSLSSPNLAFWLCRGKVLTASDVDGLTEEEQKLEVAHVVLRREKRYRLLRRQLAAFDGLDRAEAAQRERISDEVRMFVWQRDGGKCVKCSSEERLEYDHIIPLSRGGSNTERNIQLLCGPCNREKGASIA